MAARTAEQTRRLSVDADDGERRAGDVDRLADRIAPTEELSSTSD